MFEAYPKKHFWCKALQTDLTPKRLFSFGFSHHSFPTGGVSSRLRHGFWVPCRFDLLVDFFVVRVRVR